MKLLAAAMLAVLLLASILRETSLAHPNRHASSEAPAIYDSNPSHIWNRLNDALLVRHDKDGTAYGADVIDPLIWYDSEHLLAGASHKQALAVLDEFLGTHAEDQIRDPLKRALFQHNLWAVFDWSASRDDDDAAERRELQIRLAEVLRRLSLTEQELKSLPDNYTQAVAAAAFAADYDPANRTRAFLPPDLLHGDGSWLCIEGEEDPVARMHVAEVSGRSRFLAFVGLPDGRKATLDYFKALWNFPEPWVPSEVDPAQAAINPRLPQFPAGTKVALLRQMMLFDRNGQVVPAPITESIQIRVYRAITARYDRNDVGVDWPAARVEQDFYELRLSPTQFFAGRAGGLRAIAPGEKEFTTFATQGPDEFDLAAKEHRSIDKSEGPILQRCAACHSGPGVQSLQTRRLLLKPNRLQRDPDPDRNPTDAPWWEAESTRSWKSTHFDWGLLTAYWRTTAAQH